MRLFKVGLAYVGLIIAAVIVALAVAEVLLQQQQTLKLPFDNVLAPYVMFKPPANYVWKSDGPSPSSRQGHPAVAFTNADSLRVPSPDYPLSRKKHQGQFRIAMIGGSTVHVGTTYDATLPGAVKRKLRDSFPGHDIEVINGGIVSAIANQEFVFLATTLTDYDLDLLITYDGINDSGQMLYFEDRLNYPYFFSALETAWNQFVADTRMPWWKVFASRSAVVKTIWPSATQWSLGWRAVAADDLIRSSQRRREYADAHVSSWAKIEKLCSAYGIDSVFVLQPTSLYAIFPRETQNPQQRVLYANYLVYEDMRSNVRQFARTNPNSAVLDLAAFIPRLDAYIDGAHVYDEVNDEIALEIAKAIEPRIRKAMLRLN